METYIQNHGIEKQGIEIAGEQSYYSKKMEILKQPVYRNHTTTAYSENGLINLEENEKLFYINEKRLKVDIGKRIYGKAAILVVGANSVGHTNCLKIAKKMNYGYAVNLTSTECWSSDFFDDVIFAEHKDLKWKENTLNIVREYMNAKKIKFDAVVTFYDYSVQMTSYLASELGCLGIPFEIAKKIQHRYEFRKYCNQLGIVTVKYNIIKSEEISKQIGIMDFVRSISNQLNNKLIQILTLVDLPFVVKNPIGDFVRKCSTPETYRQVLLESLKFENMDLLIEEFYNGHELDIDILVQDNKAVFIGITDNFKAQENYLYETGGTTPSVVLAFEEKIMIENIVSGWIPKFNVQNALLHLEAFCRPISLYPNRKYDLEKPFENVEEFFIPIEMKLRLGDFSTWSMNYAAYNVDLFTSYIHLMLGLKFDHKELLTKQQSPESRCCFKLYSACDISYAIESIRVDMENIWISNDVVEIGLFKSVGTKTPCSGWIVVREKNELSDPNFINVRNDYLDFVHSEFLRISALDDQMTNKTLKHDHTTKSILSKINSHNASKPAEFILEIFNGFDPIVEKQINVADEVRFKYESGLLNLTKGNFLYYLSNTKKEKHTKQGFKITNPYREKAVLMLGCLRSSITFHFDIDGKMQFKKMVLLRSKKTSGYEEYFDDKIYAEISNIDEKEETLKTVKAYMKENSVRFDAVLTFYEECVQMAAYLAGELGCRGIPFDVAQTIQNKFEFRKYCDRLGIVTPKYDLIKSNERRTKIDHLDCVRSNINRESLSKQDFDMIDNSFSTTFSNVGLPFIVKNPRGAGKDFIWKCTQIKEFQQALLDSLQFDEMDLLIEEYYDGHELDINILVQNNKTVFIGITDNSKPQEPYFFESDQALPSQILTREEISAIETIIADLVPKLNVQNALLHFEAFCRPMSLYPSRKYDIQKPMENVQEFFMPIEVNLRAGGGETWSMNYAAYDINLSKSYFDLMLGFRLDEKELQFKQNNPKHNCISMIYFPDTFPCEISEIKVDIEALCKNNNIVELALFGHVGFQCTNSNYIGWMTIKDKLGSTYEELVKTREDCMKLVNFKFIEDKTSDLSITSEQKSGIENSILQLAKHERFFYINESIFNVECKYDYSDKAILVICSSVTGNTNYLKIAKKMNYGYVVNLTSTKCWSEEFFHDTIFAEDKDMNESKKTLNTVKEFMQTKNLKKFDAVVGFGDPVVQMTSFLASELGCLGIPLDVAQTIQNKYEFRKYCDRLGIVTPKYSLIKSVERIKHCEQIKSFESLIACLNWSKDQSDEFGGNILRTLCGVAPPFIIKSVNGCGKDFVRKCKSLIEYNEILKNSLQFEKMDLLIEEFYDGHELDIDILVQDNKAVFIGITDNIMIEEIYLETDDITPSFVLNHQEKKAIETIVSYWIPKFNVQNALLHLEAFCRPISLYPNRKNDLEKPFENIEEFFMPIEMNLRLGGVSVWSMIYAAYNVDLFTSYIHLMLGLRLDQKWLQMRQQKSTNNCLAFFFIANKTPTSIESIRLDIDSISKSENVIEIGLFKSIGEVMKTPCFIGWMTIKDKAGTTYEKLVKTKETCLELVKIEFMKDKTSDLSIKSTQKS